MWEEGRRREKARKEEQGNKRKHRRWRQIKSKEERCGEKERKENC